MSLIFFLIAEPDPLAASDGDGEEGTDGVTTEAEAMRILEELGENTGDAAPDPAGSADRGTADPAASGAADSNAAYQNADGTADSGGGGGGRGGDPANQQHGRADFQGAGRIRIFERKEGQ